MSHEELERAVRELQEAYDAEHITSKIGKVLIVSACWLGFLAIGYRVVMEFMPK